MSEQTKGMDSVMQDPAKILSYYIYNLRFEDIPEEAAAQTRIFILDYLAAAMAGKKVNADFGDKAADIYFGMGGREEATVLFSGGRRLPAANAAFMCAVYAHGADMDDGSKTAMGHVAAPVMPAVFALAEALAADGKPVTEADVVTAINAGYEVFCRVGAAAQPGLVRRGFHSTGMAGALAAAAACAKLMGLDCGGIYNAISISVTQACGLIIVAESGQCCKPLNPAHAASAGILSARLAAAGVKAFDNPLGSEKGWFHAVTDTVDESMITDGLGTRFSILDCYLKPYPSCRHTHCGLECAEAIYNRMRRDGVKPDQIDSVRVYIYENAIKIAGRIKMPANDDEAKFSIHYSLACMLACGFFSLDSLDVASCGDDAAALIDRIELIADASMENRAAGIRGCRTEVTAAGKVYSHEVKTPKGEGSNPMTEDDVAAKLASCAVGVLAADAVSARDKAESIRARIKRFAEGDAEFTGLGL